MQIDQQSHQLGYGDARMRVVELNRSELGEATDVAVGAQMPVHEVLQRRGDKEIFLPQPQLLPRRGLVARVENLRDRFRLCLLRQRSHMFASVERIERHRVGRARGP